MEASQFGARLRELRVQKGWTQSELATAAGLSATGVADIEQSRREPALRTLLALAKALGVDLNAFTVEPSTESKARRVRHPRKPEPPPEPEKPKHRKK